MNNPKPFISVQSKKKETEDAYITKFQRITVVEDKFKGKCEKKETLYMKGTIEIPNNTELPQDYIDANYKVEEHPTEVPDEKSGGVIKMNLKWLHLK